MKERSVDRLIALALLVCTVIVLAATSDAIGFTRDEGYYFKAGDLYFAWFEELASSPTAAVQKPAIDKHLEFNHEHPVLVKFAFALSDGILHKKLGVLKKRSTAMRFPAWLFSGAALAFLFLLARQLLPRRASLLAALMFIAMPRVFWHAHLACFDLAVCAAHLWLVLAYVKGRHSISGALVVGIAFGLAAATKHNVLVTPAFFVLHFMLTEMRRPRLSEAGVHIPKMPLAFWSMAILGPIVFVLHWPYLWPDVFNRLGGYLGFHLNHEHYPILYFKQLLDTPPFPVGFPFVMSALTIPVPILLLMLSGVGLGVYVSVRFLWARLITPKHFDNHRSGMLVPLGSEGSGSMALLLLINAAFPFALIALPSSPIFGGTKHWMNALPFICILAAWALEEGCARAALVFENKRTSAAIFVALGALLILPGVINTARVHPYGLGSYNAFAGFTRGAATLGLQRTFWGYESRAALPMVNRLAAQKESRGLRVHVGDTNRDDFRFYKKDKMLDDKVHFSSGVRSADVAIVQPQGEFKKQFMKVKNEWAQNAPHVVLHAEGVPMATVNFKRKSDRESAMHPIADAPQTPLETRP